MRVHTGSGMGTSGNMTILMRRDPGSGSPLTDVGGAWIPARLIYFMVKNVQKALNYSINDFTNSIKVSIDIPRYPYGEIVMYICLNLPSEYLGGKSLAYLELGIPQLVYLRLLQDPSMVLYLLLGHGPTGGWHPAPCGAEGISPKL